MWRDPFGIMLWLPRVIGWFLIVGWTMPTGSKALPQILNSQGLIAAGSTMAEYDRKGLEHVPPRAVAEAVKVPSFATHLKLAKPLVKLQFMLKLVGIFGGRSDLVKYMPDALVPYAPRVELGLGTRFTVQDLNSKPWTPEQAAMFFDDLIKAGVDFNSQSAFILSGFTCTVANSLSSNRFQQLAKAMKQKRVSLKEDQLRCLEKSLRSAGKNDFNDYPGDLFLFFRYQPAVYGTCDDFVKNIGEANVDILKRSSLQRKRVLQGAFICLNIHDYHISKKNADVLGHLVCDLDSNYIATSGRNLLKQLSACEHHVFMPDQITAIRAVLSRGDTPFGSPRKWTASSLDGLRGMAHFFDHNIIKQIPVSIFVPWLKKFIANTKLPREKVQAIVQALQHYGRRTRAAGCPAGKTITDTVAKDIVMPIDYTPEELRACLSGAILERNLGSLSLHAFTLEQIDSVKEKLDELFPKGYPDRIVRNIGGFINSMTAADIKKWKITSTDTLASVLANYPRDKLASQIIKQYTDYSDFVADYELFAIGTRYICLMDKNQIDLIEIDSIKISNFVDPSECSQTTKNILYDKATEAFFHQQSDTADYYNLMKPYLGGAPPGALRAFKGKNVNMDISTVMHLKKSSLMNLTPSDMKDLMGINLNDLIDQHENNPQIIEWLEKQGQEELDKIGLRRIPGGGPSVPPHFATTGWSETESDSAADPHMNSGHNVSVFHVFLLILPLNFFLL